MSTNNNTLEKTQSESFGERKAEGLFYAWKQNKPSLREGGLHDLLTEHESLNPKTMLITKELLPNARESFSSCQAIAKA